MKKLFVIGMAALLLVVFTMPAMAKVKIGGIVFTDFYYLDRDKENAAYRGFAGTDSYTVTAIQVPNITRLYGRWTNEDNVGMYIEFGIGQDSGGVDGSLSDGVSSVRVRHAYGWWNINPAFRLMFGHSTTPFSPLNPSQLLGTRSGSANIIGLGYGDLYSGRFAQVRGEWKFGKMARLELALVDPNGGTFGPWASAENNSKLPRFDITLPLYFGPVHVYPGFLYQHRTVDTATPAGVDNDLDTYIASLGAKMGFGPFGLALEGNWGKNWANTRNLDGASGAALPFSVPGTTFVAQTAAASLINNAIEDAETWSFWIDLSYKFGPITPHLMYGTMKSDNKFQPFGTGTTVYDTDVRTTMWGFSFPIDLAKGMRLRPEFMWYDDGDFKIDGPGGFSTDLGKYAIYGIQFQITF
jgi:hypothetical protein